MDKKHLIRFESLPFQWRSADGPDRRWTKLSVYIETQKDSELTKGLDNGRFLGLLQSIGNSFTVIALMAVNIIINP